MNKPTTEIHAARHGLRRLLEDMDAVEKWPQSVKGRADVRRFLESQRYQINGIDDCLRDALMGLEQQL